MYRSTDEVPDDVTWSVAPLRRKYTNKFERWDVGTLCTQQYTLYIVGTFRHVAVNHLQPVVKLYQCSKDGKMKKKRRTWLLPCPNHLRYQW